MPDMQKPERNTGKFLDEILKTSPDLELSPDFADRMSMKFEKYTVWKQNIREFLILFAAGLGLLGITVAVFIFLMAEIWQKWMEWFIGNQTGVIGIGVLLVFILFADKVLLRYFSFRIKHQKF